MGYVEFSKWLKEELDRRDLTQAELARSSGLSTAQISRIIAMESKPSQDALKAIANALKLPAVIVFQTAGLLPPEPESSERIEEALYVLGQLDAEDVDEIIEIARLKLARKGGPPPATLPTQKIRKSRKTAAPPL